MKEVIKQLSTCNITMLSGPVRYDRNFTMNTKQMALAYNLQQTPNAKVQCPLSIEYR